MLKLVKEIRPNFIFRFLKAWRDELPEKEENQKRNIKLFLYFGTTRLAVY